jgi:hypothetical protein
MPIDATVSELIVREIVDRLESYEEDGDTIFTVYRDVADPDKTTPKNYQVVVRSAATRLPTMDRIGNPNVTAYQLNVECIGQVVIPESDTEATDGHAMEIAGKIVKAVANSAAWYTMDGNAINSTVGDVGVVGNGNAMSTGRVQFVVTYRHPENDPFTVAG